MDVVAVVAFSSEMINSVFLKAKDRNDDWKDGYYNCCYSSQHIDDGSGSCLLHSDHADFHVWKITRDDKKNSNQNLQKFKKNNKHKVACKLFDILMLILI